MSSVKPPESLTPQELSYFASEGSASSKFWTRKLNDFDCSSTSMPAASLASEANASDSSALTGVVETGM